MDVAKKNIVELTAKQFAERVLNLAPGEGFNFTVKRDEDNPRNWLGVRCIYTFGSLIYLIIQHRDGGYHRVLCNNISRDDFVVDVMFVFDNIGAYDNPVFAFDEIDEGFPFIHWEADGTLLLHGYAKSGEDIILTQEEAQHLLEQSEIQDTKNDIKSWLEDYGNTGTYPTNNDIYKMAREIISRKNNCDIITEKSWSIVDEVAREFISEEV